VIFLDPRVGSKHLVPLFEKLGLKQGDDFDVTTMEFGDVAFLGNGPRGPVRVGIEVKGGRGGSDFLSSMQSDRLAGHQAVGLGEHYERRYLIIEGLRPTRNGIIWQPPTSGKGRARPIFLADVRRFITGLEESGLRVRYARTPEDTARIIVRELFAFWQKDYEDHTSINPLYVAPSFSLVREDETTARIRRVLLALKAGVGAGRSKAVAQRFRSVRALATSNVEDWEGIGGIGRTIAGEVVDAVRAEIPRTGTEGSAAKRTQVAESVSARVLPSRHRVADRSAQHSRKRQDGQLGAGKRTQRGVQQDRRGRRKSVRH